MRLGGVDVRWEVNAKPQLNWEVLQRNKRKELERLSDLYRKNLESAGVNFIEGRACIVDPHTVSINGRQYTVSHPAISYGSAYEATSWHFCIV